MLIANILLILSALANLLLSFFLLFRFGRKDYSRLILGLISSSVFFWCITLFFYRISSQIEYITLWGKLAHVFGAIIAPLFFIFALIFLKKKINKLIRNLFIFLSLLFIIFSLFIFGTNNIIGQGYIVDEIRNIELFDGYYLYIIFIFAHFLGGFLILIKRYLSASGIEKEQIKYILIGTLFAAAGASVFDLLYPIFYDFSLNWLGAVLTIIMVVSMTYAIVKYRLMNIRLVLTRSILYGVLVATVAAFFALSVVVVGEIIGGNTQTSKILTYVFTSFIVVVFLDPVKRVWARVTDNIFYKDKIDYQSVLQEVGNVVAREIDLHKLLQSVSNLLSKKLKIKQVSVFVPVGGKYILLASSDEKQKSFTLNNNFVEYIKANIDILIVEELLRDQSDVNSNSDRYRQIDSFVKDAEIIGAEMVVPIVEAGELTAVFVFKAKHSGDLYDQNDINFLKVLGPQIATAIEKSKLYEEVEEFNRELQKKVDDRTKSLKEANLALEERNKFLTTMQVVTNMVTRTLDLKKVNQMIADAISSELGYIGGILSFVDSEKNVLKVGAITANKESLEAMSILPKEPREYETQLVENFNLGANVFLSGKIIFSEKMSDFFSPPVEKEIIDKVQERLGIKTCVAVPIFSEERIIGVINFLLAVDRGRISSMDIEIMNALTNQVGIVSRNLQLYNTLQKANRDLQDANMRLRELDKTKSEFLSIASHQLRTPISALKGYLSMMMDGDFGKMPDSISSVIANLFESASRLARLVNIFLNVSRIESGRLKLEKKPLQIGDMIDSVMVELGNQAQQKGVKLEYKKAKKSLPLILADPDKLREVVLNLVDNAIKYTPRGKIEILVENYDKELIFKVKDTGIGIDPDEAKTLFRKFVRGSGVAQIHTGGSGLGLFIAQKIIKEHGGNIWVESDGKGKGSTFQFVLPIYDEHLAPEYKGKVIEG